MLNIQEASSVRDNMVIRVHELKNRAVAAFWRLADKRIPKEWMLLILGGLALLLYVSVLVLRDTPPKVGRRADHWHLT